MARRRAYHRRDLPPNLYERNNGYYTYRDPRTGKEYKLGRNKRDAVTQAIAANMSLAPDTPSLVDRINGVKAITVGEWITQYEEILISRKLRKNTLQGYRSRLNAISSQFGNSHLQGISTKDIVLFFNTYISEGKKSSVKLIRSIFLDLFNEAIAAGHLTTNPVEATKTPKIEIKRGRLTLDEFFSIRKAAENYPTWFGLSMDLALVTGQRVGDIKNMEWNDIKDNMLWITQQKTGMKLAIPIAIELKIANLSLLKIIEICRETNPNGQKIIGSTKTSSMSTLNFYFCKARLTSGIAWENSPPTFHEIRSLSARLYTEEKGKDFAQKLLGHKSSVMTDKYRDSRGKEWVMVCE